VVLLVSVCASTVWALRGDPPAVLAALALRGTLWCAFAQCFFGVVCFAAGSGEGVVVGLGGAGGWAGVPGGGVRLPRCGQCFKTVQPYQYRPTLSAAALSDGRYWTGKSGEKGP